MFACTDTVQCAHDGVEFKYVTLIENILMKQWHLERALDITRGRMDYEKLLPKQRKAVEAFFSVFACLPAGYRKNFCHSNLPLYSTVVLFSTLHSRGSALLSHAKHRTD